MPVYRLPRAKGFASRTFDEIKRSPYLDFLPDVNKRRSPVTQGLILKDLYEFDNETEMPRDPTLALAVDRVRQIFALPKKVKMIHLSDIFRRDDLEIWNKSPGLPWKDMGYKTKGAIRDDPDAIQRVRLFWHLIKCGKQVPFPDSCAYVRSHVCEPDEFKVRAVWGYPATVTFGEAVFALPLIEAYKNRGPIAYGFEPANGGFMKLRKRFAGRDFKYGFDFSKFDKSVPAWLVHRAFDILALNIDFTAYRDYGVAQAQAMIHMYDMIRDYCVNTRIRLATGLRYCKTSGIASGSYFTQLIGSICNAIILEYCHMKITGERISDAIYMGDDSLMRSEYDLDVFEVGKLINDVFGMHLNFAKSSKSRDISDIKFLGFKINHGIPFKERSEWIASLLYPERPDTCFEDVQNRALGIYYSNMCCDAYITRVTRALVELKPFTVDLPRNLERVLKIHGHGEISANLPSALTFFVRLMNG